MEFRREVRFEPGYDYREEDAVKPPGARRGCHGMNIRWLLHGDEGTVQFLIYTMWLPSWVVETEGDAFGPRVDRRAGSEFPPMGADVGYHWDKPVYEGMTDYGARDCDVRPSGHCWYDGSGLAADRMLAVLLTKGGETVWTELEGWYRDTAQDAQTLDRSSSGE